MKQEEVEKAINDLNAQYSNTADFSVDQGKVVLDQENKRLEAEVKRLREAIINHCEADLTSGRDAWKADKVLWAHINN